MDAATSDALSSWSMGRSMEVTHERVVAEGVAHLGQGAQEGGVLNLSFVEAVGVPCHITEYGD